MRSNQTTEGLKITMQYRARNRMVYELESGASAFDVHVWQRAIEGEASGWRVEAHNGRGPDAVVVAGLGASRTEALLEVARAWADQDTRRALPPLDWNAIVSLLGSVRAL